MAGSQQDEQRLALFIDFENIAIGVRDAHYRKFDINLVLERLLDKGKLLVKKAYADWSRYSDYKRAFHEAAIELIEVPQKSVGGKNSADIRLVVDAMDMSFQKEHINCFVVASGDSDFSPLVSKLKENNKYVIGVGVKNSTSDLLIENCDEFIFYEDLVRGQERPMPRIANVPEKVQECFSLLVDSVIALQRENKEILWGSMVKETMKRKKPQFNETYYGFRTFSHLLEDAQRRNIVILRRDQRSGSYIVEDLASASASAATVGSAAPAPAPAPRAEREQRPSEALRAADAARAEARAAEAPREARTEGEPAPAEAPAEGEAAGSRDANGARTRRRRGRGRRRVAAANAEATGQPETPDEMEADEGDEGDEEVVSDAAEAPSGEAGPDHGDDWRPRQDEPAGTPRPAEPEPPRPAPSSPSAAAPELSAADAAARSVGDQHGSFSFFSWLRREPSATPAPPAPERAKEERPRAERPPAAEGEPEEEK